MCFKGMTQVSCVPAGRRTEAVFWGQFSLCRAEGSHQGGEMQKEARPTVCQVFPAGDSSLGEGCSGRTLAWRRISGSKATE